MSSENHVLKSNTVHSIWVTKTAHLKHFSFREKYQAPAAVKTMWNVLFCYIVFLLSEVERMDCKMF